ncbi:MAG: hypothetical protein HC896_14270 [Bacteroidales bacterium]|nr:hypothetical protein [Bacteroidales bacterium]
MNKRLFVASVLCFIAFVASGQYLIEMSEKERVRKNGVSQKYEFEHAVKNNQVSDKGIKASVTKYDNRATQ